MIIVNKAKCRRCGDVIESKHRHDFKTCSCGAISVDGGHDYIRRCFKNEDDIIEMSEEAPDEDEEALSQEEIEELKNNPAFEGLEELFDDANVKMLKKTLNI